MNIYDFDGTICYKDCTLAFWKYCILKNPLILLLLPIQGIGACLYSLKLTKKTNWFFIFLRFINVDNITIKNFVDKHEKYICNWYFAQKQPTDVIVSASPEFLIKEFCSRLGVSCVASQVDIETGKSYKPVCKGKEKVKQFRELYPDAQVLSSYGNSESDKYIMEEGKHAYLVQNFSCTDVNIQQWY